MNVQKRAREGPRKEEKKEVFSSRFRILMLKKLAVVVTLSKKKKLQTRKGEFEWSSTSTSAPSAGPRPRLPTATTMRRGPPEANEEP